MVNILFLVNQDYGL